MAEIVFLAGVFILFGLVIIGGAWFNASLRVDARTHFESATAEILDKESIPDAGYRYRIRFRTERRRRVSTEVTPTIAAVSYDVGDEMPVRYDPEYPQDVYIDHPDELTYQPMMARALSFAGTFIVIGVGLLVWLASS